MSQENFQTGQRIFYREEKEISLVEVLKTQSNSRETQLRLRVLQTCNHIGEVDAEFDFFRINPGGSFGMASIEKDYPSYMVCRVLMRHLFMMGLEQDCLIKPEVYQHTSERR